MCFCSAHWGPRTPTHVFDCLQAVGAQTGRSSRGRAFESKASLEPGDMWPICLSVPQPDGRLGWPHYTWSCCFPTPIPGKKDASTSQTPSPQPCAHSPPSLCLESPRPRSPRSFPQNASLAIPQAPCPLSNTQAQGVGCPLHTCPLSIMSQALGFLLPDPHPAVVSQALGGSWD